MRVLPFLRKTYKEAYVMKLVTICNFHQQKPHEGVTKDRTQDLSNPLNILNKSKIL